MLRLLFSPHEQQEEEQQGLITASHIAFSLYLRGDKYFISYLGQPAGLSRREIINVFSSGLCLGSVGGWSGSKCGAQPKLSFETRI